MSGTSKGWAAKHVGGNHEGSAQVKHEGAACEVVGCRVEMAACGQS